MSTITKHIKAVAQAPTARGSFSGEILYNDERGDHDNERIESWRNIPTTVDLMYQHSYADPAGAVIGVANARSMGDGKRLQIAANLDLGRPMAKATHERLLLPRDDPQSMSELSVGFSYDPMRMWIDANGVKVLPDCTLIEVSVVARGAQETRIYDAKSAKGARVFQCRRGHQIPVPKTLVAGTHPASVCKKDGTIVVWAPPRISDTSVRSEIKAISRALARGDGEIAQVRAVLDDLGARYRQTNGRHLRVVTSPSDELVRYREILDKLEIVRG